MIKYVVLDHEHGMLFWPKVEEISMTNGRDFLTNCQDFVTSGRDFTTNSQDFMMNGQDFY